MPRAFRDAVAAILSAALSPPCATCGRVLDEPLDGAVCRTCWASLRVLAPPLCPRCGYPVMRSPETHGAGLRPCVGDGREGARLPHLSRSTEVLVHVPRSTCLGCAELREVDRARSLGAYEGVLRDVLHALKYTGRRSTAPRLAHLLRERCGDVLDDADAVVPVPLHPLRSWSRGFNQAALVAAHLGPPVRHLLCRRDHTPPQAALPANQRAGNVAGAFAPSLRARLRPRLVHDACLVLVDDVSTTGATLNACARVLKANGAREVRALTVARTLKYAVR